MKIQFKKKGVVTMRGIVIKKIQFDNNHGTKSYYLVMIDHFNHKIEFEDLGGAAPSWDAVHNFFLVDKDMQKEIHWALTKYKRKFPISFEEREGMSGCRDISLCVHIKATHNWAEKYVPYEEVLRLHISCAGKLNEGIPDMFAGDLLELLVYTTTGDDLWKKTKKLYKYLKPRTYNIQTMNSSCGYYK